MNDDARRELHARQTAAPQRVRIEREAALGPISAIAVALKSARNAWRLTVHAELVPGRPWRLGAIVVPIPATSGEGSRVVAIATVPGASSWVVDAMPEGAPADPNEVGELELAAADVGTVGLVAVGRAEVVGERRRYTAAALAAGATLVTVDVGRRVRRVAAWQVGAGGTVAVNGGLAIPLPPNGTASVDLDQYGIGAGAVAFAAIPAGGGGYLVEYLE